MTQARIHWSFWPCIFSCLTPKALKPLSMLTHCSSTPVSFSQKHKLGCFCQLSLNWWNQPNCVTHGQTGHKNGTQSRCFLAQAAMQVLFLALQAAFYWICFFESAWFCLGSQTHWHGPFCLCCNCHHGNEEFPVLGIWILCRFTEMVFGDLQGSSSHALTLVWSHTLGVKWRLSCPKGFRRSCLDWQWVPFPSEI